MKYILVTLSIFLLSSCNRLNTNNSYDYFFEIEFAGEINRVQGFYADNWMTGPNVCWGNTQGMNFSITDITADNYISGQNISMMISFDNAQLGSNTGTILNGSFLGYYIGSYLDSLGVHTAGLGTAAYGFAENGPTDWGNGYSNRGKISNINITDLGKSGGNTTIKGSYQGILYFVSGMGGNDYDIPVPIRIEFSAVRL